MSRPLRIEYDDAFYHIIARGERREIIFTSAADKDKFLAKVGETAEKYLKTGTMQACVQTQTHHNFLLS